MDPQDIIEIHQVLALYGHVGDMPPSDEKRELQREVFTSDAVLDMTRLGFPVSDDFVTESGSYTIDVAGADASNYTATALYNNATDRLA